MIDTIIEQLSKRDNAPFQFKEELHHEQKSTTQIVNEQLMNS